MSDTYGQGAYPPLCHDMLTIARSEAAPPPAGPPPAIALPPRQHIIDMGHPDKIHFDHGDYATAVSIEITPEAFLSIRR